MIDFGTIYVNSKESRVFEVRNELRKYIRARIIYDGIYELEDNSDKDQQVIPPSQTAGYELVFQSGDKMVFNQTVTYIINEKKEFKFQVKAEVVAVTLSFNRSEIEFNSWDDKMYTTETL